MTTNNVAKMTPEQLRTRLAEMQIDAETVCQVLGIDWVGAPGYPGSAARAFEQLRDELATTKRVARRWLRKATERERELAQARTSLSAAKERTKALYVIATDRNRKLTQARADLVHTQTEAARLGTALADACAARDALAQVQETATRPETWYETEYTRACQSLAQAREELKNLRGANRALVRQLEDMTGSCDFWYKKAHDTEAERDRWRGDWESAQAELLNAQTDLKLNAKMLADQCDQAREAENEAAGLRRQLIRKTEDCNYWRTEWRQDHERLATLDAAEEALQTERTLRQVAETGERAARKTLAQTVVAQADADLAAHFHSKAIDELTQTVKTERRLRQEAQEYVDDCRIVLTGVRKILDECQVEGKYDASAVMRIRWLNQRTERAEALSADRRALAQLANKETAELLQRMASSIDARADGYANPLSVYVTLWRNDAKAARTLATQIKEALDEH